MQHVIGEISERHSSSGKVIEWYIPQFSSVLGSSKHFHRSSSFYYANSPWHLQLFAGTMLNDYLSVYLQNDSKRPCRVSFMFSIKDINGRLVGTMGMSDIILADNKGVPNFFTLSLLGDGNELLTPSNSLKIVCQLKLSHLGFPSIVIGRLYEHGCMREKHIEWQIPNFTSLFRPGRLFYHSPSFSAANTSWHLELHLGTILNKLLSLFLYNESGSARQVSLLFSIRGGNGRFINCKGGKIQVEDSWGFQDYLNMECFNQSLDQYVPSNCLTILCDVTQEDVENGVTSENLMKDELSKQLTLADTEGLSKSLRNFLDSQENWDTILKVQEQEFKVHRAILIARSPVFAAMFRYDMEESKTGVVNISDCDPDAFKKFLMFLYTGELKDMSLNDAFELYSISDKYDEMQVKLFCCKYIGQSLSIENFCDVVKLAYTYSDIILLTSTQFFFNENYAKIIVTEDWKTFLLANFDLANEFLVEMARKW